MAADKTLPENENASEDKTTPSSETTINNNAEEQTEQRQTESPRVRMRQKTPITSGARGQDTAPLAVGDPAATIQRMMGALYEAPPELEDSNEEIRRLDSQLDHLNDYMDKVEERLRQHNDKLQKMLTEQKAEREKRRQSFHERMQQMQQEDSDFQEQLSALLNRVDMARHSVIGNSSE